MASVNGEQDMDYRAIVKGLPGLFVIMNAELTTFEVSDAYNRATMTRREGMLKKTMFEVFPDKPDDPLVDGLRNLHASLRSTKIRRA